VRELSFEMAFDTAFKDAMADFDATAWRPFLRALDGDAPRPDQREMFEQCTGRTVPFTSPPRTAQACCGVRSGKSKIGALLGATAACFWDHRYLSRGERAKVMLISQTRDQAQVLRDYVLALLESNPVTKALIDGERSEIIRLNNGCDIQITHASFRSVRGFTCPLIVADEVAFWRDTETSTNPAKEIFRALAPRQATVPQPLMLSISSPFSKEGHFYETHSRHWGDEDSAVLCWQAPSATMNPTLDPTVIEQAYVDDPEAAAAEYGAQFRSDVASFIDRDKVMACIEVGRTERGCLAGQRYVAFCDPSGGSKDSFTAAIAHLEGDEVMLDRLLEIKAPFDPGAAVGEVVHLLKEYGLGLVTGDRYASGWVPESFKKHGVTYRHSIQDRSAIYLAALPLLNSGRAKLLDSTRMVNQLCALQRRTGSSGKQSVDHMRNGADDLANSAMGALVLATSNVAVKHTPCIVYGKNDGDPYAYLAPGPSYSGAVDINSFPGGYR
jgi:hypothetical protein